MLSAAKSSIFFSSNTEAYVKLEVCETLDIMSESLNDKYLGLPALVGTDRSDCFRHLIDRISMRINGWKEKLLSMDGKEILWQNHPNYAGPRVPIIVLKTSDYYTRKPDNTVVCWVSSGNRKSSIFYNSYMINNGVATTLQHLVQKQYTSECGRHNISLQNMFK